MSPKITAEKWERHWSTTLPKQGDDQVRSVTSLDSFGADCYRVIKKHIPKDAKRILEIGCGTGRFSICMAEDFPLTQVEGSDIAAQSVSTAQEGASLRGVKNVVFYRDDLMNFSPRHKNYDFILMEGLLHYLPKKQEHDILYTLAQHLAPGGALIIGVPNRRFYLQTAHNFFTYPLQFHHRCWERSYRAESLSESFRGVGLDHVQSEATAMHHGFLRAGRPWAALAKRWNESRIPKWNGRYGFYLFVSGRAVK